MVEKTSQASDSEKLKELVRRTGEFIAYFEIAETKMLEWHHNIELKLSQQTKLFNQYITSIETASEELSGILTQAGAARWRLAAEQALASGKQHLEVLKQTSEHSLQHFITQQQQQTEQTNTMLNAVERVCSQTIEEIKQTIDNSKLLEFQQSTQQATDKIEQTSIDTLNRGERIIKSIQMKSAIAAIIASTITALTIGLYMSDEMPWEIHKHAMHERSAGKVLLNAWPNLSQRQRHKILAYNHNKPLE